MSYIVLARKWRPKRFAEMIGQEHVLRALSNALDSGKVHHAFLFTGTRGVGKTTVARILAKSLNCEKNGVSANPCGECTACREIDQGRFIDLIEVDAASRTKVDDTRELLDNVPYAPSRGRYKVYLIDEVHMLSTHSFNALLKTLEEPPPHVKFLFATTDPQKLPVTVLSRCLQFSLKRLPTSLIGERLKTIAAAEHLEYDAAALALIARAADGSVRDALSLLDQLIAFGGGALTEANARSMLGTIDRRHITRIVEALACADGPGLLAEVRELDRDAPDYDRALVDLAALLQRVAIAQIVPQTTQEDEEFDVPTLVRLGQAMSAEDVQLYYQIALGARRDLAMAPDPRLGFEMALLRMLAFRPDTGLPAAIGSAPRAAANAARASGGLAPGPVSGPATSGRALGGGTVGCGAVGGGALGGGAVTRGAAVSGAAVGGGALGGGAATRGAAVGGVTAASVTTGGAVSDGATAAGAGTAGRGTEGGAPPRSHSVIDAATWPSVVDAANLSGMARQFALNCVPASFENDALVLKLDQTAAQWRARPIEDKLQQGLSKYLGRDIRVLFDVSQDLLATAARQRIIAEQDKLSRAASAFEEDPVVKGLRERFGAEVDAASVKPANF